MAFGDERRAFDAYADAMPGSATFLVDTYDTARGIDNAIAAGLEMKRAGRALVGIRLDSGDLAALAQLARARLDAAGLTDVQIFASNDLDEHAIAALRAAGAPIDAFGVGTRLVTGGDQAALGAVYKLGAIWADGAWSARSKRSSDREKASLPGRIGVHRRRRGGRLAQDVLFDLDREEHFGDDLLVPVMRDGERRGVPPSLEASRSLALREVSAIPLEVARLTDPLRYSVVLSEGLAAQTPAQAS
jgi:nicotinate phosphoribosyltransferase